MTVSARALRAAVRARVRATAAYLYTDPNVRVIDVGWKIVEKDNRRITDQLTVRVHLQQKPRGAAFESYAATFPQRIITPERIGFPVDIIEASYPLQWVWPRLTTERIQAHDPLQGGISVSKLWSTAAGTLGGIVTDLETGEPMLLSNWHVLVGSAYAAPNQKMCQPAYGDGGGYRQTIAKLKRHAMNQGIDAAVARLTGSRHWRNYQLGIGPVTGVARPELDMRVVKSGRSSQITEGIVTGIEGIRKIYYGGYLRTVRQVFHIALPPGREQVSTGGDSGSWWLSAETKQVVGLHFAGSDYPEYSLAMTMPDVMEALKVDLAQ